MASRARHLGNTTLGPGDEAALGLALASFVVAMAYSASYDSYSADLSAPAAFDALTVLSLAGAILFLWSGRLAWFLLFAMLGCFARPSGLLFLVFLGLGSIFVARDQRGRMLAMIAAGIGACVLASFIDE